MKQNAPERAAAPGIVLASASPRRRELMQNAGWTVEVRVAAVDETPRPREGAEEYVVRLARAKALAVARGIAAEMHGVPVLGADTTVVVDGEILGKPGSAADAARMLERLSGRAHEVWTGVCVIDTRDGHEAIAAERTRVWFDELSKREIAEYVDSGEPMDKAGAYGIQGLASKFIPRIEGCYFNVVGLPVARVFKLLQAIAT